MTEFVGSLIPPRQATAPASPTVGQLYYDTGLSQLRWWSGTAWVPAMDAGGGTGGPTVSYDTNPIGSVVWHTAYSSVPDGYLVANGQSVLESDYLQLAAFAALEVAAGNPLWAISGTAPNRSITLPDLRDRFLYSKGASNVGVKAGEVNHLLTGAESGTNGNGVTNTTGAHAHGPGANNNFVVDGAGGSSFAAGGNWNVTPTTASAGNHAHSLTGRNADTAHNNMPPYCVMALLIKGRGVQAAASGGLVYTQTIGDGSAVAFTVVHGLGSRNVTVAVYRSTTPYDELTVDVERTDANTVTIRTLGAVLASGAAVVAVNGPGTPASGGPIIADEGTGLPNRPTVNFTGGGVTATDDGSTTTNVRVPVSVGLVLALGG